VVLVALGITAWVNFKTLSLSGDGLSIQFPERSSDVKMEMGGAHQEGELFRVEVCYSVPDERDWTITRRPEDALLRVEGRSIPVREEGLLSFEFDANGKPIKRCEYLDFPVEVTPSSQVSLVIQKIFVSEPEKVDCARLQGQLDALKSGIVVQCPDSTEKGIGGFTVVQKPSGMALTQALEVASDILTEARKGPWEFTFQYNP